MLVPFIGSPVLLHLTGAHLKPCETVANNSQHCWELCPFARS